MSLIKRLTKSLQELIDSKPALTEEELLHYGSQIFPSSVTEIIAENRDR